jgi:GTP-binding protein EngB required for normal cell division
LTTRRPEDRLGIIRDTARQVGAEHIATEAIELRDRLVQGRFYVACVGQFKRGKSTLLNALIGQAVLPVGVVPVTAVVTVIRYGRELHARVQFGTGTWTDIGPSALREFVSEVENPENVKGVTGVEVLVPSDLLRDGMCLVDTPGIGSVFSGNTEATREFVPHIDAALVVLGADPPISGAELDLVDQTSKLVERQVFVLNKADRLTDEEREQGKDFAASVLCRRLGREAPPILEVSAAERMKGVATRDWVKLEGALRDLAEGGAEIVRQAEARGVRRLADRLTRQIDEQREALIRPQEESAQRIDSLRRSVADAERTLSELEYLFKSVQDNLSRRFEEERETFLRAAIPLASVGLDRDIDSASDAKDLPAWAMDAALRIAKQTVEDWRSRMAPVAEGLYGRAVARFVEIANDFLQRVADAGDPALRLLPGLFESDLGFTAKPRFHFTEMMTLATPTLGTRLSGITRASRMSAAKKNAAHYLDRLLATNSARVANDFSDQVLESRRRIQVELREHLRTIVSSAESALHRATERRSLGESSIARDLETYKRLRAELNALTTPSTTAPRT